MKIIISHDVDHISSFEHLRDLFLPKYLIRNTLELFNHSIGLTEYRKRIALIFKNKFNNIEDLAAFDINRMIKPTFFLAVNNALGLSYSLSKAEKWASYFIRENINLGIHGINFKTQFEIQSEKKIFEELTGLDLFGIRMHYLRLNSETLINLNESGYRFDSTVFSVMNPYKIGNMWEFPVCLMDSDLIYGGALYQNKTLDQIKSETIGIIVNAEQAGINYFTIVTHDFYFSDAFKKWKDWYIWITEYLKVNGYEFISFDEAISEL